MVNTVLPSSSEAGFARRISAVDPYATSPHGEPCDACGSPVESLDKFCPACGTPRTGAPSALNPQAPRRQTSSPQHVPSEPVETEVLAQKFFRCQGCGSEVATDPNHRSYVCPFCDSTYVVEFSPEQTNRQRPEFVIGFAITMEKAMELFHQWIRNNSWFRPGDLSDAMVADKMKGIYLPFWSFSMLAESQWSANIGEHWYRTETYTETDDKGNTVTRTRQVQETEWWPLSGRHHRYYSGYLVSGSRGLPQNEADRIQPFQLPALRRYEPYYLAGWFAEEYSVTREEAQQRSQAEFYRWEQSNVSGFLPGDTHRGLNVQTNFSNINSDLCLLPVYVLSYRYQNHLYRFLINGQTGKLDGDKPISWKRIWLLIGGVAITLAVIVIVLNLLQR